MTIILNTTALSTFRRTNSLDAIAALFRGEDMLVPDSVMTEFAQGGFATPAFLRQVTLTVAQKSVADSLTGRLHVGECEAIVLAQATGGILLTDDREAKKKAKALNVDVAGCLAVIKDAFVECHIDENERDRIISEGKTVSYWPEEIVNEILALRKGPIITPPH